MRTLRHHVAILTVLFVFAPLSGGAGESNFVRVQFREADTLFANPGQGWMNQQRSPRGEPRFPCSVVYIRFNWDAPAIGKHLRFDSESNLNDRRTQCLI